MKKRYLIIPLIVLGVMLFIAPFTLRVKMANDNQQENHDQQQEQNQNTDRSVNGGINWYNFGDYNNFLGLYIMLSDNGFNYHNTSNNLSINDSYSISTNRPIVYDSNNGSRALIIENNNLYKITTNSSNIVTSKVLLYENLEITNIIYLQSRGKQTNSPTYRISIYENKNTLVKSYDDDNEMSIYFYYQYSYVSTYNSIACINNYSSIVQYNSNVIFDTGTTIVNVTNDSSVYFNNTTNNGIGLIPYYMIWEDTSLNANYELLRFNNALYPSEIYYSLEIQPNYNSLKNGRLNIVLHDLVNSNEQIMYTLDEFLPNQLICIYVIQYVQNTYYMNIGIEEVDLNTNQQFIFNDVDDVTTSAITIDSISYSNCITGSIQVDTSQDPYKFIARNMLQSTLYTTYQLGYNQGQIGESAITPFINLMSSVFSGVNTLLNIQIIPNIKLWYFISIPLFFIVIFTILKIWKHN